MYNKRSYWYDEPTMSPMGTLLVSVMVFCATILLGLVWLMA